MKFGIESRNLKDDIIFILIRRLAKRKDQTQRDVSIFLGILPSPAEKSNPNKVRRNFKRQNFSKNEFQSLISKLARTEPNPNSKKSQNKENIEMPLKYLNTKQNPKSVKNDLDQKLISKKKLYHHMSTILRQNNVSFRPREMAFFMSIFDANKTQQLDIDKVTHALFEETDLQYLERKSTIPKGPPPKRNGYLFDQEQKAQMRHLDFQEEFKSQHNKDPLERVREKFQSAYYKHGGSALAKFRDFDVDKDGMVTLKDVADRLSKMAVFGESDMNYLMKHFGTLIFFIFFTKNFFD